MKDNNFTGLYNSVSYHEYIQWQIKYYKLVSNKEMNAVGLEKKKICIQSNHTTKCHRRKVCYSAHLKVVV